MPGKLKQVAKKVAAKAASKKTAGKKTVSKSTSPMVATAQTTTAATTDNCSANHITTQAQAIQYMQAEVLWSQIFVEAWTTPATMTNLQQLADTGTTTYQNQTVNTNQYILMRAAEKGYTVTIPDGVTLKVVIDTAETVHLLMPAVQNMPPRPVDMVPHAL